MLNRALALAGHGFLVFPCRSDKFPATLHGFKDASKYADRVRELWRKYPGTLVGIACGYSSDLAVLDLDRKHPEAHAWWKMKRPRLPTTYTVRTRSGGLHLYYRHRPGLTCSVGKIAPGVDVRSEGGYAIARAEAGCPVLHYAARADWPECLSCLTQSAKPAISDKPILSRVPENHMLAGLVRRVAHAQEGERNSVAFWAARRMGGPLRHDRRGCRNCTDRACRRRGRSAAIRGTAHRRERDQAHEVGLMDGIPRTPESAAAFVEHVITGLPELILHSGNLPATAEALRVSSTPWMAAHPRRRRLPSTTLSLRRIGFASRSNWTPKASTSR